MNNFMPGLVKVFDLAVRSSGIYVYIILDWFLLSLLLFAMSGNVQAELAISYLPYHFLSIYSLH